MKKVAVIVAVIAIGVAVRLSSRSDDSDVVLAEVKELIAGLETYPKSAEYLDAMLEREHRIAFDE
ncbi:MAG: hypothetical protein C4547_10135 [Phycisphaerales bacterium]|nr:MAG: hypothetical protein C4547_10135 [Phycisphaerales bacterium]